MRNAVCRALPVQANLDVAVLRGWIQVRLSGIPDHVRRNIESVLGGQFEASDMDRIARRHVEYSKRTYVLGLLPLLRDFDDPRRWPVEGLEHLNAALAGNRGAILATAHLGYQPLIGPILRVHGYEVEVVSTLGAARRVKAQTGGTTCNIVAGLGATRPILAALSLNRSVVIAGEGMRAAGFEPMSLFGEPYPFPTGFIKIAMLSGAPVLPVFAIEGDRRHRVRIQIHDPLKIDPAADAVTNLKLFVDVFSEQLKRTPHLWSRWSTANLLDKVHAWSEVDHQLRYTERWR